MNVIAKDNLEIFVNNPASVVLPQLSVLALLA